MATNNNIETQEKAGHGEPVDTKGRVWFTTNELNSAGTVVQRDNVQYDNPGYTTDDGEESSWNNINKQERNRRSQSSTKEQGRKLNKNIRPIMALVCGCFNVMLSLGFPLSIGVFFVDWLETFEASRAETASIQSTCTGLTFLAGVVVGFMIQKFGVRVVMLAGSVIATSGLVGAFFATSQIYLLISIGIVVGSGSACVMLANNVNVTLAFRAPGSKAFALGCITACGGVGSIIFPLVLSNLKDIFGWRGALILAGGAYLNVAVFTLLGTSPLWRSRSATPELTSPKTSSKIKAKIQWRLLLNPLYFAYLSCALVGFGTIVATAITAVDFSMSRGFDRQQGLWFLTAMNATSATSRFLSGLLQLFTNINTTYMFSLSLCLNGATLILISTMSNATVLTACFSAYGFGSGGMVSTYAIGILGVVGDEMYPVAMGIAGAVSGTSNTSFGIIMGTLYDILGSYDLAYRIFGGISATVSFAPLVVMCLQKTLRHKTVPISQT